MKTKIKTQIDFEEIYMHKFKNTKLVYGYNAMSSYMYTIPRIKKDKGYFYYNILTKIFYCIWVGRNQEIVC